MAKYSWKLYKDICDRLEDGQLLMHILKTCNITRRTFYNWVNKDEDHTNHYNQCLEMQLQHQEDRLIDCGREKAVRGEEFKYREAELRREIQTLSLNIGRKRAIIAKRTEDKDETPEIRVMNYKKTA